MSFKCGDVTNSPEDNSSPRWRRKTVKSKKEKKEKLKKTKKKKKGKEKDREKKSKRKSEGKDKRKGPVQLSKVPSWHHEPAQVIPFVSIQTWLSCDQLSHRTIPDNFPSCSIYMETGKSTVSSLGKRCVLCVLQYARAPDMFVEIYCDSGYSQSLRNASLVQIRLKIDKTKEDIEAERKRKDLLASLNEMYE